MQPVVASYREFMPCEALKDHVRAFFSFIPAGERKPLRRPLHREVLFGAGGLFCPLMIADGRASVVFNLGTNFQTDGIWHDDPTGCHGQIIGAVSKVVPVCVEPNAMIGVYFHAAHVSSFAHVPACELTDRTVAIEDLWGAAASELSTQLAEMNEAARIDNLESVLLRRLGNSPRTNTAVNVPRLAASVIQSSGRVNVESLAADAGVSRQHLTRLFREFIGISSKLFCRLARFQSSLVYAGCGKDVDWAQAALELGYADQSHMISEFREFCSLTPQMLATERWFHPFIERAILK